MTNTVRRPCVLREKRENGGAKLIHYDARPELREVVKGLVKRLDPKRVPKRRNEGKGIGNSE